MTTGTFGSRELLGPDLMAGARVFVTERYGSGWRNTYARRDAGVPASAQFVWEREGDLPLRVVTKVDSEIGFVAEFADCDPALPTLRAVLRAFPDARVVRYRPQKRCTLVATCPETGERLYLKVLADERGQQICESGRALWEVSSQLAFRVAPVRFWKPELRLLAHGEVAGAPAFNTLMSDAGAELAAKIGAALATLARAPLICTLADAVEDQNARTTKYLKRLKKMIGGETEILRDVTAQFAQRALQFGSEEAFVLHGAPHPHQWLTSASGPGLIDFDRLSAGPRELDVATFLAELDFESIKPGRHTALEAAFIGAYEHVSGPLDPAQLCVYRAHKHVAKALRAALSLHPDCEVRARQALASAQSLLEATP